MGVAASGELFKDEAEGSDAVKSLRSNTYSVKIGPKPHVVNADKIHDVVDMVNYSFVGGTRQG